MLENFLETLLLLTLSGSIACGVLLLFKRLILKNCGGLRSYYIWLLPLLLFLIPLRVDIAPVARQLQSVQREQSPVVTAEPAGIVQQTAVEAEEQPQAATPLEEKIPSTRLPVDYSAYLAAVWAAGAVILLGRYLLVYNRYQRRVTRLGCMPTPDSARGALKIVREEMGISRNIGLVSSIHVSSPLMTGFFQPKIILPCQELTEQEFILIFRHELTHYKHGDIWYKFFAAIANAAQWFNPLSYLMVRNINESCEYACDESVTRSMDAGQRRLYSEMILKMLSFHALAPVFVSHLSKNKKILKRRFSFIMEAKRHKKLLAGIAACLLLSTSVLVPSVALSQEKAFGASTYYNPYQTLEWNLQSTLDTLQEDGITARVLESDLYIDSDGIVTVPYNGQNRNQPVLSVDIEWVSKESALPEGAVTKQYNIEGNELTVAFWKEAASYVDNPIIDRMIQNRFAYELHYQDPLGERKPEWNYDHPAFVKELMRRGYFTITAVTEPSQFQPMAEWTTQDGGTMAYSILSQGNQIDTAYRFWEEKIALNQNMDGNQGKQFADSFVIPAGKTLAFNIEAASDSMGTMNVAIIDLSTGLTVDWLPNMSVGTRLSYTPGDNVGQSFKIMVSTEELYGGEAQLSAYIY